MKLRYELTIMDMGGEMVAVPTGDDAAKWHGILKINEVSAEILGLLKEETDPGKIHRYLKEKYPQFSDDDIGYSLAPFLSKLYREGLLEDRELDERRKLRQEANGKKEQSD